MSTPNTDHRTNIESDEKLSPNYAGPYGVKKQRQERRPKLSKFVPAVLPDGPICEGDTSILPNILSPHLAEGIFERLDLEVQWQTMSHRGGEVPRLVAVQGSIAEDQSIPIYRHPADASPPLLAFSSTVDEIRHEIEKYLGHDLNHVLIQKYRKGPDYISDHSDKTLDIMPNTFIVNVSLGAERAMVFKLKKDARRGDATQLESIKVALPHNSLCKLGLMTNMRWTHEIRPDKRMEAEKTESEKAYGGERISLTFRSIGTFLDKDQTRIWGQGATSKNKDDAKPVINGKTVEAQNMIDAFGMENKSSDFDWHRYYGNGFDILHTEDNPDSLPS